MARKTKTTEIVPGYRISLQGRHVQVTEGMKDHAIDKISKIEKFSDRLIDVQVTMDIQKLDHRVDVLLRDGHIRIRAQATSNDMYTSIDRAVGRIQRQLRKYRQRLKDHQAKKLSVVDLKVNVFEREDDELEELNDTILDETHRQEVESLTPRKITKSESIPLKLLTQDEALMKMELSQDNFMVYRSEEDMALKIIYCREDNNYGIIQIESDS